MKYLIGLVVTVIIVYTFNQLSDLHKNIVGDVLIAWVVMNVVKKLN